MMKQRFLTLVAVLAFGACGFAASPSLGIIQPRGAQRGTDATFVLSGGNLADAQEVFFYSTGFTVTKLEVVNAGQVKATVKIAADASSANMPLVSGRRLESPNCERLGRPTSCRRREGTEQRFRRSSEDPLNCTVHGVVDNEDVDYFSVETRKASASARD